MTGLDHESSSADPSESQPPTRRARRTARREERWNRPPPSKDWRWWVGGIGRVFIVTGLLMFGFVAYQLWGTGIEYARSQNELDDEFAELLASASTTASTSTTTTASATSTTAPTSSISTTATAATTAPTVAGPTPTVAGPTPTVAPTTSTTGAGPTTTSTTPVADTVPVPNFDDGDVLAQIQIPTIDVDTKVVSGVSPGDLKKGPGHYTDTPMPGQLGNSAVAGHRTTYGQPFFRLDELDAGDEIAVTTIQGRFVYTVTGSEVVGPGDSEVVATTDPTVATLTLTTCDPKYTATNRLIVYADLDTGQSGPGLPPVVDETDTPPATLPGEPVATTGPAATFPGDDPTVSDPTASDPTVSDPTASDPTASIPTSAPSPATTMPPAEPAGNQDGDGNGGGTGDEAADAFAHGWFSDGAAWPQVAMWALATALVAAGGWFVARLARRYWVGALAAIVPFAVTLFFFYENVNRLLPPTL